MRQSHCLTMGIYIVHFDCFVDIEEVQVAIVVLKLDVHVALRIEMYIDSHGETPTS